MDRKVYLQYIPNTIVHRLFAQVKYQCSSSHGSSSSSGISHMEQLGTRAGGTLLLSRFFSSTAIALAQMINTTSMPNMGYYI